MRTMQRSPLEYYVKWLQAAAVGRWEGEPPCKFRSLAGQRINMYKCYEQGFWGGGGGGDAPRHN